MPRHLPRPHELLAVSEPCSADWGSMSGDERVRFCAHCRMQVHDLSEFTPREALDLVLRSGKRLCLGIEHDARGVPRTRALTEPLYQIGRRVSRLAAGTFGAALTLCTVRVSLSSRPRRVTPAEAVCDLFDAGAKVNLRDEDGETVLMSAAEQGRADVVELLLKAGARVNVQNKGGRTALMNAAAAGNADSVRLLPQAGADHSPRDAGGRTALRHARAHESDGTPALLLAYGAYEEPEEKGGVNRRP